MKITPNLWFNNQAEQAAEFYTSIFKDSKIKNVSRYTEEGFEVHHKPAGSAMQVEFELNGQTFLALNGSPEFKFNESISFVVPCKDQEEIDYYWDKLSEGGDEKAQMCGWLKDKYGVSWQIIPESLSKIFADSTSEKAKNAQKSILKMKKIIISELI